MRANPKALLALASMILLGACNSDSSTAISGDASGTYTLQSVNGNSIPWTFPVSATANETINSGGVAVNPDHTFSLTITYTVVDSGQSTTTTSVCTGTYTQSGGNFTFVEATSSTDPNCGFVYGGSWNGSNTFTLAFSAGVQAVFTK